MKELEYKIVHSSKRKTLTITVERDRTVVVRAPEGLPDEEVRRFVDAKRQWILEKQNETESPCERYPCATRERAAFTTLNEMPCKSLSENDLMVDLTGIEPVTS
jgi:predicted metal-dependent hydrolase